MKTKTLNGTLTTIQLLSVILLAVSLALSLLVIYRFHHLFPFQDDWTSLSFYIKNGFWGSVLCQHNRHPMVFPNLAYRLALLIFDGDALAVTAAMVVSSSCAFMLLARLTVRRVQADSRYVQILTWLAFMSLSVIAVWLVMRRNLLWGIALVDYFTLLGSACVAHGVAGLVDDQRRAKSGALIWVFSGAIFATFSFGSGAAIWGAVFVVLCIWRSSFRLIITLSLCGMMIVAASHLMLPNCYQSELGSLRISSDLANLLLLIPGLLGSLVVHGLHLDDLAWRHELAQLFGVLELAYLIQISHTQWRRKCYSPDTAGLMTLAWFAVGVTVLVGMGRLDRYGLNTTMLTPRYLPYPVIFLAAILGIFLQTNLLKMLSTTPPAPRPAVTTVVAIAIFSVVFAITTALNARLAAYSRSVYLTHGVRFLVTESDGDRLIAAHALNSNRTQDLFIGMDFMRENNLGVFRNNWPKRIGKSLESVATIDADTHCVGAIFMQEKSRTPTSSVISGWTRLPSGKSAEEVYVVHNGHIVGIGLKAPIYLKGRTRDQVPYAGEFDRRLLLVLPTDWATLLGINAAWAGAIRTEQGISLDSYELYAVMGNGTLCQVKRI